MVETEAAERVEYHGAMVMNGIISIIGTMLGIVLGFILGRIGHN